MTSKNSKSLFDFDKNEAQEYFLIGTDEAGRGPGAGGVFAAAVYFKNPDKKLIKKLALLNDSKQLSKKTREELFEIIKDNSIYSVVCVEVEEIEKINILNASLKAMKIACENVISQIKKKNIRVLVDGNKLIKNLDNGENTPHPTLSLVPAPTGSLASATSAVRFVSPKGRREIRTSMLNINQKTIVKGDSKSASIAAASILAKVSRDRYMTELDKIYPNYNWKQNAGYLTKEHLDAIDKYGLTEFHRKSFLRKHFEKQLSLFK